jgi:hypothetical protein
VLWLELGLLEVLGETAGVEGVETTEGALN